jgi:hypothetical protein
MIPAQVGGLFSPGASDWIVTIATKDGRWTSRRISPGTMDEKAALRVALAANGMSGNEVESWSIRKAGDREVVADQVEDAFARIRRMR